MEIQCPTCLLRPLRPADAPVLAVHANDRDVWLNLTDAFPHPYSVQDAEAFITAAAAVSPQTSFGIVVQGEVAGNVGLTPGHDIHRKASELGYFLGRKFWGRGIMTDVVRAVTRYAFDSLGMHRVFAVPYGRNTASARVLEKAGFVREGVMRHSAIKDGVLLDQLLYAAYDDDRVASTTAKT
jgi:[ribosomal protein S5]-alanine N-acetyltransferase